MRIIRPVLVAAVLALAAVASTQSPVAAASSIAARAEANVVDQNARAYIVGNVNPRRSGETVVLERGISGRWSSRGTATTDGSGSFRISIRPSQSGIYAFRVRSGGVASPTFYLRVLAKQYLDELDQVTGTTLYESERYVDGKRYSRALSTTSCRSSGFSSEYNLGRRYRRFDSVVGMSDDSSSAGARNYYVYADGQVIASGTVSLGAPRSVSVPVGNVLRLKIEWRSTGGGTCTGRFVLGNPALRY